MVDEIQTLIEMKQQILLRHIVYIEYFVVVDLIKILSDEKPYLWEKGFAGVSHLQNMLDVDLIQSLFILGVFHISQEEVGKNLAHFYKL